MRKSIAIVIGILLIISSASNAFAEPRNQKLQISITPEKGEYLVGEQATFEIEITRGNHPAQILPRQIAAVFPDEETQVTLSHISKGYYRYTTFPLEAPGEVALTVKVYRPGTFRVIENLQRIREKIQRRIDLLEKRKEEETKERIIKWLNRIIQKYQAIIKRIDRNIANILRRHLLAQESAGINDILLPPETPEETLEIIEENNRLLLDMKADMTLSSKLNRKSFGDIDYSKYYFKQPNKIKIESYLDKERTNKGIVYIIDGSLLYIIYPGKEEYQMVSLLEEGNIEASQFNQMNILFDLNAFLEGHNVVIKETNSPKFISILEAI